MEMTPAQYRAWIVEKPWEWSKRIYGVNLFEEFWTKPVEIIQSVFKHRRTAVKGCVASSKSVTATLIVHAWLQHFPRSKVFLTAPSDRQVKNVLWSEVRALYHNAKVPLGGVMMPKESRWDFPGGGYALGFSTDDPNRIHGIHGGIYGGADGGRILFIIDEAQGIDEVTFQAIENIMSDGRATILLLENPTKLTGEAYEAFHSKSHLYNCITIAAGDTPNVKYGRIIIPGMMTKETCDEWAKTYGENSNFVRVKRDALFPNQEPNTLIPMDWIEQAFERVVPQGVGFMSVGQDVAWEGDDDSVLTRIRGRQVLPLERKHGADPMAVADAMDVHLIAEDAFGFVDVIGIGAGVFSREAQRRRRVTAVNVAEDAYGSWEGKPAKEHFFNLRAQIAWMLRVSLDPSGAEPIALPRDSRLQAQLSAIKYKTDETSGRIRLQAKKDMKKDLGYSPDDFDSLALANWGRYLIASMTDVSRWAAENANGPKMQVAEADSPALRGLSLDDNGGIELGHSETLDGLGTFNE